MPEIADIARNAGFGLGAIAAVSGVAHWIAVTVTAVSEHRGYDARLGNLLVIGLLPVGLGIAMVAGSAWASSDRAAGLTLIAAAAGLFTLVLVVLWPGLSTGPNGSAPGTAAGIAGFAALAVLAWVAR